MAIVEVSNLCVQFSAKGQTKSSRAFALAVAGVDDDQAAALALGFFIGFFGGGRFNMHSCSRLSIKG